MADLAKNLSPRLAFLAGVVALNLRFGAWLTADSIIRDLNTDFFNAGAARISARAWQGNRPCVQRGRCAADEASPIITRVSFPAFAKFRTHTEKLRVNFYKLLSVVGIITFRCYWADGGVE
ncbi:oligosaccharide flippase family protein [Shigella flexneri]